MERTFPYLLLPHIWSSRNRAKRRERGDLMRAAVFGSIGVGVCGALFGGAYWLTVKLMEYAEFGDYLLRLGLSWLFLTFLAFLAFSGVVTALSTFFLADDLRVLMAAPVSAHRLFLARFARTVGQSSWMVVIFLTPVLLGVGAAYCAPPLFYATAVLTVVPFSMIPVAFGTGATLMLVNILPARRARDILMLMGLAFAAALILLVRFMRPEQLLRVESLPDITDFFATLQSPVTPLLPSFWAGESLFASLQGGLDWMHGSALWTTALVCMLALGAACERWQFPGYSRSQEAPKARVRQLQMIETLMRVMPLSVVRRQLLIKDMKIFLRDISQVLQLLPLVALMLLYLYNFRVLDLERIPYVTEFVKGAYGFVNLGMAGFVMATVAVRFVFPAVSAEGWAFWIIQTSPISMRDFLWSKFWAGLLPVFIMTEALTIAANELLGIDPFLKVVSAIAILFMSFALVGLATGLGAKYPRFGADANQVAGSYGGVAFMILAVLYIIVMIVMLGWPTSMYLFRTFRGNPLSSFDELRIGISFGLAIVVSIGVWLSAMRSGVQALEVKS
jgi:ABC-2 type transport system permease protein